MVKARGMGKENTIDRIESWRLSMITHGMAAATPAVKTPLLSCVAAAGGRYTR